MKETIILTTNFEKNYWSLGKIGKYPKTDIHQRLPQWKELKDQCPLLAIGLYTDKHQNDSFDFIIIKDITIHNNAPVFDYDFIAKGKCTSQELYNQIESKGRLFYFSLELSNLISVLNQLNEKRPERWDSLSYENALPINSINITTPQESWEQYIGSYFLALKNDQLSNNDFEDRTAKLLTALGFKVNQKGHQFIGTVADGVATLDTEFGIVYDCKNRINYKPDSNDMRAIDSYHKDEQIKYPNFEIYPCFIPKTTTNYIVSDKIIIPIESLLFLLYKKLEAGNNFRLNSIQNFFRNKRQMTIENIKVYWD